jgi:small-conductance mechanosensitive channel
VEGIIEGINVRTTSIRAPGGELYVGSHGEIRVVRNFSGGDFVTTKIKLKVAATGLNQTLSCLEKWGEEAVTLLPNLVEPWEVMSESGAIGQHIELIAVVKARFDGQQSCVCAF